MSPLLPFFVGLLLSVDCTPQYQKDSLMAFYIATGGPFWLNTIGNDHKWDNSTDPCETPLWFGVGCGFGSNTVISLELIENNLTGSLTDLQLPDLTLL